MHQGIERNDKQGFDKSSVVLDELAKPTFRSRYAHTPFTEQSEGPMDTVASNLVPEGVR